MALLRLPASVRRTIRSYAARPERRLGSVVASPAPIC
jgi:hypothetical protein